MLNGQCGLYEFFEAVIVFISKYRFAIILFLVVAFGFYRLCSHFAFDSDEGDIECDRE